MSSSGSTIAWMALCLLSIHSCNSSSTESRLESKLSSLRSDVENLQRKAEDASNENDRLKRSLLSNEFALENVRRNDLRRLTVTTGALESDNEALKHVVARLRHQVTVLNGQVYELTHAEDEQH